MMDVMVGGGSARSSRFALLGTLLKNGMKSVAETQSSTQMKTDLKISSPEPTLTGPMKDVVDALRYGHRFKPEAFVAATKVSLIEFQAIAEHVESMGRRCELIQGEVVVRALPISAQHEAAKDAFNRTFTDMTMRAGTFHSFRCQGSASLQPGGANEIEADSSFTPKKRLMDLDYSDSKTRATIAFEVAYGNESLKKLKMKMDLYMLPTSVVQIVIGMKLPFQPGMLSTGDGECTILYAEKAFSEEGSNEKPGKGRHIERKVVMNNPDFGPADPDFPGFPDVILPREHLFEGVEGDNNVGDGERMLHFVPIIVEAGVHRFSFRNLIAETLDSFKDNEGHKPQPRDVRVHPYRGGHGR